MYGCTYLVSQCGLVCSIYLAMGNWIQSITFPVLICLLLSLLLRYVVIYTRTQHAIACIWVWGRNYFFLMTHQSKSSQLIDVWVCGESGNKIIHDNKLGSLSSCVTIISHMVASWQYTIHTLINTWSLWNSIIIFSAGIHVVSIVLYTAINQSINATKLGH